MKLRNVGALDETADLFFAAKSESWASESRFLILAIETAVFEPPRPSRRLRISACAGAVG
jgi:hypothetical protein